MSLCWYRTFACLHVIIFSVQNCPVLQMHLVQIVFTPWSDQRCGFGQHRQADPEDPLPSITAMGLALLHPTSMEDGEVGSPFSRLLSNSRWALICSLCALRSFWRVGVVKTTENEYVLYRLGRRMLVRMLRTDIGEVSNRGAWVNPSLATPDIMQLYKAPLRLHGWANAIMEVKSSCGLA